MSSSDWSNQLPDDLSEGLPADPSGTGGPSPWRSDPSPGAPTPPEILVELPEVPPRPSHRPRWLRASLLLLVTFFTTTTLGSVWVLWSRVEVSTTLQPWLGWETIQGVWSDPATLGPGLQFALAALFILFCHEMGHYLACRWYRLPATLPYFLPAPLAIGTFGAFIRIRAPIRSKRQLFDVGVGGPLAGFVALLPFLVLGVAWSRRVPVELLPLGEARFQLFLPGKCLALELMSFLFHGPAPEGTVLEPHPFALAAWFGLFATSLNLLPLGQLDGGHLLYAATGALQRRLALPLWLGLVAMAWIWPGWILWCGIVLLMGLPHPPIRDESVPLDRRRRVLAWVALVVFLLSFMPVPLLQVGVGGG